MRTIAAAVMLVLCAAGLAVTAQEPRGRVAGRVTDHEGNPLAGAVVLVAASSVQRETISDPDGRFLVPALPAGRYSVAVSLAGFQTATRIAALDVPRAVAIDVVLDAAWVSQRTLPDFGVATNLTAADAVMHIRVLDRGKPSRLDSGGYCVEGREYRARVLGLVKAPSLGSDTIRIVRTASAAYSAGDELIVFLHQHPSGAFVDLGDNSYAITGGSVHWTRTDLPGVTDGAPIARVMEGLRGVLFMTR